MGIRSPREWRPPKVRGVDFTPDKYRDFVIHDGATCYWQKGQRCPCVRMSTLLAGGTGKPTGEAQPDCAKCYGRGYFHHDGQVIPAVILGVTKTPAYSQLYGEAIKGMASITVLPEHMLGEWDRITKMTSWEVMQESRPRQGAIERCRYLISEAPVELGKSEDEPHDKLETTDNGIYISWADSDGVAYEGDCIEGTDFEIVDGLVSWLGTQYAFATGSFIVPGTADEEIKAGTRYRNEDEGLDFVTTTDATFATSGYATITMRCTTRGEAGNVAGPLQVFAVDGDSEIDPGDRVFAESANGTSGGVDGTIPRVGDTFTIRYYYHPAYIVNDTPHPHRDTWVSAKNPERVNRRMVRQVHAWSEHMGDPFGYNAESTVGGD